MLEHPSKKIKTTISWARDSEVSVPFADEITLQIFGFLKQYVVLASMVCRQWFRVSQDKSLQDILRVALDFDYLRHPFYCGNIDRRLSRTNKHLFDVASLAFFDGNHNTALRFHYANSAASKWLIEAVKQREWFLACVLTRSSLVQAPHVYDVLYARWEIVGYDQTEEFKETLDFLNRFLIKFMHRFDSQRQLLLSPKIFEPTPYTYSFDVIMNELINSGALTNADVHYTEQNLPSVVQYLLKHRFAPNRRAALRIAIENDYVSVAWHIVNTGLSYYGDCFESMLVNARAVKSEAMNRLCTAHSLLVASFTSIRALKNCLYQGRLEVADHWLRDIRLHPLALPISLSLYAAAGGHEAAVRWITKNNIPKSARTTEIIAGARNAKLFQTAVELGFTITPKAVCIAIHNVDFKILDIILTKIETLDDNAVQMLYYQRCNGSTKCLNYILDKHPDKIKREDAKNIQTKKRKYDAYVWGMQFAAKPPKIFSAKRHRLPLLEDADCDIVYAKLKEYRHN